MRQLSAAPKPRFVVMIQTGVMLVLALFAVILASLPVSGPSDIRWVPAFPLIFLYFWTVHRPDVFARWIAFLMGLFQDIITNGPLGLWALVYVCTYEGVFLNRHFFVGRAAYSSVVGFAMAAGAATVLVWVVAAIYSWRLITPVPLIGQMFVTVIAFPFVAWMLSFVNRQLGAENWD